MAVVVGTRLVLVAQAQAVKGIAAGQALLTAAPTATAAVAAVQAPTGLRVVHRPGQVVQVEMGPPFSALPMLAVVAVLPMDLAVPALVALAEAVLVGGRM